MAPWTGDVAPDGGDIVLRTPDKEVLRLVGGQSFLVEGTPAKDCGQIVDALRAWLNGSRSPDKTGDEPAAVVLTIGEPTAVVVPAPPPPIRTKAAIDGLKAALKEREAARTKAIGAVTELLTVFQRTMRPLIVELGATAKTLISEKLTEIFDAGGTIVVGPFGMEWTSGEYVVYHTGKRTQIAAMALAAHLVDKHQDLNVPEALDKIAVGVETARDGVLRCLSTYDRIRQDSTAARVKLEREIELPKAIEGPKAG